MFTDHNIYSCGDHALTVSFGKIIEPATNEKVFAVFQQLKALNIDGIKDVIPAYTTVTVVYDIQKIKKQTSKTAYSFIYEKIEAAIDSANAMKVKEVVVEIPVCYDLEFGIDLEKMSTKKNLSIEEIVEIHTNKTYRVYMLGFLPGFAYMGILDERIATPRLATPRRNVAAGSVGIAGDQTGIYPFAAPGGWNIIGRTPNTLFDTTKENPCFFEPGNMVRFTSITREQFEQLKRV